MKQNNLVTFDFHKLQLIITKGKREVTLKGTREDGELRMINVEGLRKMFKK